ncbi:MAG: DUF4157 domain-containing protein [Kofleriaceae bacterium]
MAPWQPEALASALGLELGAAAERNLATELGDPADLADRRAEDDVREVDDAREADDARLADDELARRATEGAGGSLPHLELIQAAFGHHDVSGIRAHQGGGAAEAANALGASAFAIGDAVAFSSAPDLHTAAHEAAHVVQQRDTVQGLGGLSDSDDPHERHADAVADAVVAGGSAEALLDQARGGGGLSVGGGGLGVGGGGRVQRKRFGGALITEQQAAARRAAARDVFPGPIKLSVVGDPFEVNLQKVDGKLAVKVTYVGPYAVESTAPRAFASTTARTITLLPDRRPVAGGHADESRPIAAQVLRRTETGVVYDLHGDGSTILELGDRVDEGVARFDRRTHMFTGKLNGFPTMPAFLAVELPQGQRKSTDPQEQVVSTRLRFGGDEFTLRARRHGDSSRVVVAISSKSGDDQVIVPVKPPSVAAAATAAAKPGTPREPEARAPLRLKVLKNDGRDLHLDLDGDGQLELALVHTVRAPNLAPGRALMLDPGFDDLGAGKPPEPPSYVHTFSAYDADGVRVGDLVHKLPGYPGAVPANQDAFKSPPPGGAAMPASRQPVQGDVPGETSRGVRHPARDWELRLDGDGDRGKELLLRFIPGPAGDPRPYSLYVVQLSTGAVAMQGFRMPGEFAAAFETFGPQLLEAADGDSPAKLQLGATPSSAPILEFSHAPFLNPTGTAYRASFGGVQPMVFFLPAETRATAHLTDWDAPPNRPRKASTIETIEVELSEFRDRFRLTAEKVDSGEVLLGVSALAPEGPVSGFSTRLFRIYEPRLDPHVDLPTQLSFYARPDWGFANLFLTSAIDPPKDAQGRILDAPPSAHRDHRLTLHGDVVIGRPQHTFRVRDGRFVGGWEQSTDNRHAAGAAMATGVLEEQNKHVQVGEFRIQIDAALDAEIQKAVELGWIDGLTLDAWASLRDDMVFVQAQGATGKLDPARVRRAMDAVQAISEWLSDASRGEGLRLGVGHKRRPAPGSTEPETFTGIAVNTFSGEVWRMKDSVLIELRRGGHGPQTAQHLEAGEYGEALQSYQQLRNGVGRWLAHRFEKDPKFGKDSPEATRLAHLAALGKGLQAVESVQTKMVALDASIDGEIALAANRGIVPPRTLGSWNQLREDMVLIAGQTAAGSADAGLVERAVEDAKMIDWWLELETQPTAMQNAFGTFNAFTGEVAATEGHPWVQAATSHGRALRAQLKEGEYGQASESYRKLRDGVVRWVALRTERKLGESSAEARKLRGLQEQRAKARSVMRVPATFIADDSYEAQPDKDGYKQSEFGKYRQVPMQLFVWADDGKWHIRDLTNPNNVWEGSIDFHEEAQPPPELFRELNHKRHLPKGVIHYHLPDGFSGRLHTEERKEWYEWVGEVALVLAAVGLVLLTLGAATPLVVGTYAATAFAMSAVAGTVASIGELIDGLHHGYADGTMIALNVLDIVSNLASLGAMAGGKLAMGAARAANAARAGRGTAWTGALAHMAQKGGLVYRPLVGLSVASDGLSLLIMTTELQGQMNEIDETVKDPHDRLMAKAKLLARFAVSGGLVLLSIKGDLPDLKSGAPRIVLDKVHGVTVARVGDVSIGKTRIELPEDANLHATARWQTQDLEAEARGGKPDQQKRTGELLADEEFQRWYGEWMKQPKKLHPGSGKPKVQAPEGAPPEVVKRLQAVVDRGDVAIYQQAFAQADEVAKLREAAGALELDPSSSAWPATRKQLVENLTKRGGGRKRAEKLVARYEAARRGAGGDPGQYAEQRAAITKRVPDSELERIKDLYGGHEVYVTGKPGAEHVEVAVVVPNGTEPGVMNALEQRAHGHAVHVEPSRGGATEPPLRLRAKVMTEDQFFGMATASVKGRGAPSYHRLGDDLGQALGFGSIQVRPAGAGRYTVAAGELLTARKRWQERGGSKTGKLKYDPDANALYFELHGGKERVRVEAPLPARILSASDWKLENRIVGTKVYKSLDRAEDVLRKIAAGDLTAASHELGVAMPKDFTTSGGIEFGVGELPDGRFVIVRGEVAAVDWSGLPGVKARGHTHPAFKGNDLNLDAHGQRRVSVAELTKPADVPLLDGMKIYPSPEDVHYMSVHAIGEHRVVTGFIVQDGFVMKPPPGHAGKARLEFVLLGSEHVGNLPNGLPVHRATVVGVFEGKQVLRTEVHVTPGTKADPDGALLLKPPADMVPLKAGSKVKGSGAGSGGAKRTTSATRAESEKHLRELREQLTPDAQAEFDVVTAGKTPEEAWAQLHTKGDPKRFLEGRAAKKAGAGAHAAAKDARIVAAHQTLRDTKFFDSPLVKDKIAAGDHDGVRGMVGEHLAKVKAEADFGAKPDHVVLDDIEVSRQFGEFTTRADAEASLAPGEVLPLYEFGGKVYRRVTNIDVLVLHKREIVLMEEVKTGRGDQLSKAKGQQNRGLAALAELAGGDPRVRLHRHRHIDITDQVDASTATAEKAVAIGPDDKGFQAKLGYTTSDLKQIATDIIDEAKAKASGATTGAADVKPKGGDEP